MKLFKKLTCKHEWAENGFSYIKCELCGKIKHNSAKCRELSFKHIDNMVKSGAWEKEEADNLKSIIMLMG